MVIWFLMRSTSKSSSSRAIHVNIGFMNLTKVVYCQHSKIHPLWFVKMKIVDKYESVWQSQIEGKVIHLVTSSTWCAQALFLRIGASPCQITRMCWGGRLSDFLKLSRHLLFGLLASPPQRGHTGFYCCGSWSPSCLCLPGWTKVYNHVFCPDILWFCICQKKQYTSSSSSTSKVLLIPESA